jgi:predicted RNase H-like HicB family nuclease
VSSKEVDRGGPKVTRRYIVVVVDAPEDGGYVASVPSVPGVYGQGETEEEAFQDAVDALTFTLDDMTENGEELPPSDGVAREVELAF